MYQNWGGNSTYIDIFISFTDEDNSIKSDYKNYWWFMILLHFPKISLGSITHNWTFNVMNEIAILQELLLNKSKIYADHKFTHINPSHPMVSFYTLENIRTTQVFFLYPWKH